MQGLLAAASSPCIVISFDMQRNEKGAAILLD